MKTNTSGCSSNKKKISLCVMSGFLALILVKMPVYSAWKLVTGNNAAVWYYENADGTRLTSGWYWLDGNGDGISECYYFDPEGWMYAGTATPDGYTVNENGAWTVNGVVQTRQTGVTSVTDQEAVEYGTMGSDEDPTDIYASVSDDEQDVIDDFMDEYITDDMTDFEKEMIIIQYLVENVKYKYASSSAYGNQVYTAYGALVNGEAVCAGYAKAFRVLADECGLTVKYITGTANGIGKWDSHAWNLIKLDGAWYHVDVTWEDPLGYNSYGFGNLRNKYINLTDREISGDHKWSSSYPSCKGTGYTGSGIVMKYYLATGTVDTDITYDKWRLETIMQDTSDKTLNTVLKRIGIKMDDESNYFGSGKDKTAVINYLNSWFGQGYKAAYIVFDYKKADWLDKAYLTEKLGEQSWGVYWLHLDQDGTKYKCYKIYLTEGEYSPNAGNADDTDTDETAEHDDDTAAQAEDEEADESEKTDDADSAAEDNEADTDVTEKSFLYPEENNEISEPGEESYADTVREEEIILAEEDADTEADETAECDDDIAAQEEDGEADESEETDDADPAAEDDEADTAGLNMPGRIDKAIHPFTDAVNSRS